MVGPHVEHTLALSRSSYSASRCETPPPDLSFQNLYIYISFKILSIKLLLEEVEEWERRMVGD